MNFNNSTIKPQAVMQKAAEISGANQQQAIEAEHLLNLLQYLGGSKINQSTSRNYGHHR